MAGWCHREVSALPLVWGKCSTGRNSRERWGPDGALWLPRGGISDTLASIHSISHIDLGRLLLWETLLLLLRKAQVPRVCWDGGAESLAVTPCGPPAGTSFPLPAGTSLHVYTNRTTFLCHRLSKSSLGHEQQTTFPTASLLWRPDILTKGHSPGGPSQQSQSCQEPGTGLKWSPSSVSQARVWLFLGEHSAPSPSSMSQDILGGTYSQVYVSSPVSRVLGPLPPGPTADPAWQVTRAGLTRDTSRGHGLLDAQPPSPAAC